MYSRLVGVPGNVFYFEIEAETREREVCHARYFLYSAVCIPTIFYYNLQVTHVGLVRDNSRPFLYPFQFYRLFLYLYKIYLHHLTCSTNKINTFLLLLLLLHPSS